MQPNGIVDKASRRNAWEKVAWAVWLVALLAILGRVLFTAKDWQSVYPVYHTAADNWRAGNSLYLLVGDTVAKPWYRYSPTIAPLLSPFSLLPEKIAGLLWRLLNVVVYLSAFAWWLRAAAPRSLGRSETAVLFLLIVPLSLGSLNLAQANVLLIGLLLATVAASAEGRWPLAAGCSALAASLKIYPLALGLLLAVAYPRRLLPWLLAALLFALVLPFAFQDPLYVAAQYADFLRMLTQSNQVGWLGAPGNRDLRLLLSVVGVAPSQGVYLALQLGSAAACAALCLALIRLSWPPKRLLTCLLALAVCWMVLFGPGIESCTYILIAPTLAWTLLDTLVEPTFAAARALVLSSYGLFLAAIVANWFPNGTQAVHAYGLHPLGAVLLLGAVALQEYRWFTRSRSERQSSADLIAVARAA